jgi:hypothetical protein
MMVPCGCHSADKGVCSNNCIKRIRALAIAMETSAILSSKGNYSLFMAGGDTIRFATSPRLLRYTRVKRWEDGYLEVGVDYGQGEVEDYIDIRQILDNLYYDTDSFLKNIKKVEVRYG